MKATRRGFLKAFGHTVIGGSLAAVTGYTYATYVEPGWLSIERVQIPCKNLKPALGGLKVVQMSDFHLHPFTEVGLIQAAVDKANALKPDLTLLTGDYVLAGADSIFELAPVLAGLNARYGVFTILGNHDWWTDAVVVRQGLRQQGLPVLHNEGVLLQIGGQQLYVAGVDDCWSGQPNLEAALAQLPAGVPAILLAHEPDFAEQFARDGRLSLQLSGHSHGGQVRLPGLAPFVLPRYAEKYHTGLYQVDGMWLYTNRGIGVIGPPVRFNCPPEITEITLVAPT